MQDPRVKSAARIGNTFKLDPITILGSSQKHWLIRAAAHEVVVEDEKRAAAKANPPS